MAPSFQAAPVGGDTSWRPSPGALLLDAAEHHCAEAQALAQEAARHMEAMATVIGISPDHARRLRSLAGCCATAAEAAERIGQELNTK